MTMSDHFPDATKKVPATPTPTIIKALEMLARDIESQDGVATAALLEAAQRLQEVHDALNNLVQVGCEFYDMDCGENGSVAINIARKALGDDCC